jgi:DNA-binding beta-propeller fold protein YncE
VGSAATFNLPASVSVSSDRTQLYVADALSNCLRVITLATRAVATLSGVCGSPGGTDGALGTGRYIHLTALAAAEDAKAQREH